MSAEFKQGNFYSLYTLGREIPNGPFLFQREDRTNLYFKWVINGKEVENYFPRAVIDYSLRHSSKMLLDLVSDLRTRTSWIERNSQESPPDIPKGIRLDDVRNVD